MKFKYKLENTTDIEATLTITMKVSEWRELHGQLKDTYPSWKLSSAISDVVFRVNNELVEEKEVE